MHIHVYIYIYVCKCVCIYIYIYYVMLGCVIYCYIYIYMYMPSQNRVPIWFIFRGILHVKKFKEGFSWKIYRVVFRYAVCAIFRELFWLPQVSGPEAENNQLTGDACQQKCPANLQLMTGHPKFWI